MTIAELIDALQGLDPSLLVTIQAHRPLAVWPASDHIQTVRMPDGEGGTYSCVLLGSTEWP